MPFPRTFLTAIPKADLHVHLGGSLRLSTLIQLAKDQGVKLPSFTEEGLRELVFKNEYKNLPEYLLGFRYTEAVMRNPESLEQVAYELAYDCFEENVCYVEVRFAPQRYLSSAFPIDAIFTSVNKGLARATSEINQQTLIREGRVPAFHYGIIGCAMRKIRPEFSEYYEMLTKFHPTMPEGECHALAARELVRSLIKARDEQGIPAVGFDLAGEEKGYPAEDFKNAFDLAHRHFLMKTVHAGEAFGPPSIFQAITDCHTDRIGHGTHLFDTSRVDLPTEGERQRYVHALAEYIAERRITTEVCLTSNLQTIPELADLSRHPFLLIVEERLSCTLCTDNRLISHTTMTDEIEKAVNTFNLSAHRLRNVIICGFKRSFYHGTYREKRKYVRHIIDRFDELMREFNIADVAD